MTRLSPAFIQAAGQPTLITGTGPSAFTRRIPLLLYIHSNLDDTATVLADRESDNSESNSISGLTAPIPVIPGQGSRIESAVDVIDYLNGFEVPLFDREWEGLESRMGHLPALLGELPAKESHPHQRLEAGEPEVKKWDIRIHHLKPGTEILGLDKDNLVMGKGYPLPLATFALAKWVATGFPCHSLSTSERLPTVD